MPVVIEYFHDVEVAADGTINPQMALELVNEINYKFYNKWGLSATLWPIHTVTYQGTSHDQYISGYGINYEISPLVSAEAGLYLAASAIKSNGLEYNYAVFDQRQSTAYLDLMISL